MCFEGQKKEFFGEKSMSRAGVKASFAAERLLVVKHCVNPPRDASGGTKHVLATKLNKKAFGKTELRQKHLENFLRATWGLFPPRVGGSTCEGRRPGALGATRTGFSSHLSILEPPWEGDKDGFRVLWC